MPNSNTIDKNPRTRTWTRYWKGSLSFEVILNLTKITWTCLNPIKILLNSNFKSKIKSSLYLQCYAEAWVESGVHLRRSASGQHSSKGTSQRWRGVGDTVPIWSTRDSNPRPTAPIACALSNWANGNSNLNYRNEKYKKNRNWTWLKVNLSFCSKCS